MACAAAQLYTGAVKDLSHEFENLLEKVFLER
jgi:hypothetical protein